ncbi:GntR family transcriptional regulator [Streptomyces erythrochromogenes]|uniref:GntR family transcriptional regulator n=1 Tax=Streptomyces erythrochromogenes TaxID=285574 RepID=UPI0034465472
MSESQRPTTNGIAAAIREGISAGRYPYGSRLPSVKDGAAEWGCSQQTVASAYAQLQGLGLVRIDRGNGTIVTAGRQADAHLGTYSPPHLAEAVPWRATGGGVETSDTTLVRQLTATKVMTDWGIPDGEDVIERTRVRRLDGVPVQHKLTVIPYGFASRMPEGYQGTPPMMTPVGAPDVKPPTGVRVADWLGWGVIGTECAITAEPMDAAAAEALGVPEGTPGFRVVAIARDSENRVVSATVTTAPLHHRITLDIIG